MRGMGRMGGFRGLGATPVAAPGANVPSYAGGNSVQGKGIAFTYQTPNVASLAPSASSGAQNIQFDNNSTFLWLRSTFSVDISEAALTSGSFVIPLVTVQITDTGNGMCFMNAPVPLFDIAGWSGELPYILPTPQFIQANASYSFSFTSYVATGTTYTNLRMQLHGYRMFNT